VDFEERRKYVREKYARLKRELEHRIRNIERFRKFLIRFREQRIAFYLYIYLKFRLYILSYIFDIIAVIFQLKTVYLFVELFAIIISLCFRCTGLPLLAEHLIIFWHFCFYIIGTKIYTIFWRLTRYDYKKRGYYRKKRKIPRKWWKRWLSG